jgi:hypothetical protein
VSAEQPGDQAPRSTEATQLGAVGVAADFDAHPEACWPGAGTQTGSVASLVTWVTGTLLAGRVCADDVDLGAHGDAWLTSANTRPSLATDVAPLAPADRQQRGRQARSCGRGDGQG